MLPVDWAGKSSTLTCLWTDAGYAGGLVAGAGHAAAMTVRIVKRSDHLTGVRVLPRPRIAGRTWGHPDRGT